MTAIQNCGKKTNSWPWTRFLARLTDALIFLPLYVFILFMIIYVVNKYHFNHDNFLYNYREHFLNNSIFISLLILISLIIYSFTDSLICNKFNMNLGHRIFGLEIKKIADTPLRYSNYLNRSLRVSIAIFLMLLPIFGLAPCIMIYVNYKITGCTYWDRSSGLAVLPTNASKMRTALSFSLEFNLFFLLMSLIMALVFMTNGSSIKNKITPQQALFLASANKTLPRRVNALLIARNIEIKRGNIVFHYIIAKYNHSPFTHDEKVHLGIMKLASPKTALIYLCSPKGKNVFNYGKAVIYSYLFKDNIFLQFKITPSMCPK